MHNLLLKQIEQCREEMLTLSKVYGMTSEKVLMASEKQDKLLIEYQLILKMSA